MLAGSAVLLAGVPVSAQHTPVALSVPGSDARHADTPAAVVTASSTPAEAATAAAEPAPAPAAGAVQQQPSGPQRPMFQDIRYDEDWSVLGANPSLKGDMWDRVKYISISGDSYWSLGGEIRHRFDYWHDANFGYINSRNLDTLLQRYMFHADLHVNRNIRAFGQFASALAGGRKGGPWPTDRNEAESPGPAGPPEDAELRRLRKEYLPTGSGGAEMATAGIELGLIFAILAIGGWWLDRKFGTSPLLLLIGCFIGIIGGLYRLIRRASAGRKK